MLDFEEQIARDTVTGGSIFPLVFKVDDQEIQTEGMNLRAYYAAHAPITHEVAIRAFFDCNNRMPIWNDDADRASFFAVMALLRQEYADAMLHAVR